MGEKTVEINEANFDTDVLNSDKPVLIDFWATWCGPCKMIAPLVDEIATDYEGQLVVGKVDADENQNIMMKYGIMGIPTLILFKGGEPVARVTGFQPKDKLLSKITPHL
ncbi:MAG: thioredoxin [Aggregatilineales bacterium]